MHADFPMMDNSEFKALYNMQGDGGESFHLRHP